MCRLLFAAWTLSLFFGHSVSARQIQLELIGIVESGSDRETDETVRFRLEFDVDSDIRDPGTPPWSDWGNSVRASVSLDELNLDSRLTHGNTREVNLSQLGLPCRRDIIRRFRLELFETNSTDPTFYSVVDLRMTPDVVWSGFHCLEPEARSLGEFSIVANSLGWPEVDVPPGQVLPTPGFGLKGYIADVRVVPEPSSTVLAALAAFFTVSVSRRKRS